MPYNVYRPKPGRHGVFPVYVSAGPVTLTSAGTDNVRFGTPFRKCYFMGASVVCQTPPVITTGTSTLTIKKTQASDGAVKILTGTVDCETLTSGKATPIALLSTLTE